MNKQSPERSSEVSIQIETPAQAGVVLGPDPADAEGVRLLRLGQPGSGLRAFVSYPCLKQMLAHGQRQPNREVGGVLLGSICRSRRGLVTTTAEAVPAARTEADRGHVTFSHQSWEEIYSYLDSLAQDLQIVGWYHTHPGFGVFFSHHDRFIQENFFASPGQLGVVIDPVTRMVGSFWYSAGQVAALAGVWVSTSEDTYLVAEHLVKALRYSGRDPA